jgi:hypothetical protein
METNLILEPQEVNLTYSDCGRLHIAIVNEIYRLEQEAKNNPKKSVLKDLAQDLKRTKWRLEKVWDRMNYNDPENLIHEHREI